MLSLIFILNWTFSVIFIFLNHPLSLGCILLIQSILISLSSGFFYSNFWFSYILFLIMIGGMLVMFIYMTSIASNEKFKLPKNMLIFGIFMFLFSMFLILFMDNYYSNLLNLNLNNISQSYMYTNNTNYTLSKFFNYPNLQMMICLMIYLLVTLIATVKIVGKNFGTLRQK